MTAAFLVDGLTEQRFVQSVCKDVPVRLIGLNGNSVSTKAMSKKICSLIRLWKGRYYPIIVVVDREDREMSAIEFSNELIFFIKSEIKDEEIIIGVADRMVENWMVADSLVWPEQQIKNSVDGFSGVNLVKKYIGNYNKVAMGPLFLKKSRASEITARSSSFADFYEKISFLNCPWLQQ